MQALADAGIDDATYAPEERGIAMAGSVGRAELQELADMSHLLASTDNARERSAEANVCRVFYQPHEVFAHSGPTLHAAGLDRSHIFRAEHVA